MKVIRVEFQNEKVATYSNEDRLFEILGMTLENPMIKNYSIQYSTMKKHDVAEDYFIEDTFGRLFSSVTECGKANNDSRQVAFNKVRRGTYKKKLLPIWYILC